MMDLIRSVEFWVAMVLAAMIKLRASPTITASGAFCTVSAAVAAALVFTQPILDRLSLDGETYAAGVAALVALTAEHLARQVLDLRLVDLIKAWRGK